MSEFPTARSIESGEYAELGRHHFTRSTALLFLRSKDDRFVIASARFFDGEMEIVRSWFAQRSQFARLRAAFDGAFNAFEQEAS